MNKNKVVSGFAWKFAERIGAQGVNLIVSFILARLISPDDYGVVALITIFIHISNVFIESGLGTALVQKKKADDLDFSSVFYVNIVASAVVYLILFFLAPLIAGLYGDEILIPLIRVLGITLLIAGLKNVQQAYISREMMFKKFFIATTIGTIISAVVGIIMAYNGFGVWALVTQQLMNTAIDTLMLWVAVKWRPKKIFSLERVKTLFSYGWKLLCSALLETTYNELHGLVIGKVYPPADLAYYNRANQFPKVVAVNIDTSMQAVMLPVLSREQDNRDRVKQMIKRMMKTSVFILFPIMLGMAAITEPFIRLVLTDEWLDCVPLMQMFCFVYMTWPIHTVNLQAMKAIGRSDLFLKLEIIKKIVGVISLVVSIPLGIKWMVAIQIVVSVIGIFINVFPNRKLLKYGFFEQMGDILPAFISSITMFILVTLLPLGSLNLILQLVTKTLAGIAIYTIMAILINRDDLDYVKKYIRDFMKAKTAKGDKI